MNPLIKEVKHSYWIRPCISFFYLYTSTLSFYVLCLEHWIFKKCHRHAFLSHWCMSPIQEITKGQSWRKCRLRRWMWTWNTGVLVCMCGVHETRTLMLILILRFGWFSWHITCGRCYLSCSLFSLSWVTWMVFNLVSLAQTHLKNTPHIFVVWIHPPWVLLVPLLPRRSLQSHPSIVLPTYSHWGDGCAIKTIPASGRGHPEQVTRQSQHSKTKPGQKCCWMTCAIILPNSSVSCQEGQRLKSCRSQFFHNYEYMLHDCLHINKLHQKRVTLPAPQLRPALMINLLPDTKFSDVPRACKRKCPQYAEPPCMAQHLKFPYTLKEDTKHAPWDNMSLDLLSRTPCLMLSRVCSLFENAS